MTRSDQIALTVGFAILVSAAVLLGYAVYEVVMWVVG